MRFNNRYKALSELKFVDFKIPLRILKFHRPKWHKIQEKILKKLLNTKQKFAKKNLISKGKKKNLVFLLKKTKRVLFKKKLFNKKRFKRKESFFNNSMVVQKKKFFWCKIKKSYKEGLILKKKIVNCFFDNSISTTFLKKKIRKVSSTFNFFKSCLIIPEVRVDILLFRLNFFSSSFQARQSLNEGEILVNGKIVKGNYFLKKGDIISFCSKKSNTLFDLKKMINKQLLSQSFCPFVEIDFYTKTIVIFKSINEFSNMDFNFLFPNFFDNKKIKDYV
jgi:ribosomal protein S4